ncbi:MAG: hypothetical protein RQ867_09175 [Mariprofundaceae bacterium]|nr:hypothetical protein [Mariprofundaceae bacterium]
MTADHCLRPEFTEKLTRKLLKGESANLTGPQGRRRTLQDLRRSLPAPLIVLQANLHDYPENAGALLKHLGGQLNHGNINSMGELLDHLEGSRKKHLLILHNFDELQQGEASGYAGEFFDQLGSINSRATISLLCVSETACGFPLQSSPLQLPPLTSAQLLAELARRSPQMTQTELMPLAESLAAEAAAYTALESMVSVHCEKQ